MSGITLEELMLSRGSMTGILSRDLFCCDTLAGGGAANACVRFLCLALKATDERRDCVSQEMRHYMKRQRRACLIQDRVSIFVLTR